MSRSASDARCAEMVAAIERLLDRPVSIGEWQVKCHTEVVDVDVVIRVSRRQSYTMNGHLLDLAFAELAKRTYWHGCDQYTTRKHGWGSHTRCANTISHVAVRHREPVLGGEPPYWFDFGCYAHCERFKTDTRTVAVLALPKHRLHEAMRVVKKTEAENRLKRDKEEADAKAKGSHGR